MEEYPQLKISQPEGDIEPNETVYLEWYISGTFKRLFYAKVKCELRAVHEIKATVGPPYDFFVKVSAECSYTRLAVSNLPFTGFSKKREKIM